MTNATQGPLLITSLTKMKRLRQCCGSVAATLQQLDMYSTTGGGWPQSSQLELLVAGLQQPCSFYQPLLAHRAASGSQLRLAAVTLHHLPFDSKWREMQGTW